MGSKKTVTMMDVAKHAGVSVATVARIIHENGYVSRETRDQVQQVMDSLGYKKPKKEQPSAPRNVIGVWTAPDRRNPFFSYLAHALALEANKNDMYAILRVHECNSLYVEEVVSGFMKEGVCGIVLVGFDDTEINNEIKSVLLNCGVPVVFMERTARCYGLNRVMLDGSAGVYMATRHLMDLGHRNLVYIGTASTNDVDKQRLSGYKNALLELGENNPRIVNFLTGGDICDGYEATRVALERWPETTAIVSWSDLYAVGAMKYCFHTGRQIPQDIAITGFDDLCAPVMVPALTSAGMPLEEMAQAAIGIIVENRENVGENYAKTIILTPRLTIRESTQLD